MCQPRLLFILISLLVLFSLLFGGCALFSAIGEPVANAYTNTVAYFNAYYNAKRLFDEAEAEILAAERARRSSRDQNSALPGSANQKLNTVIDKCSNLLAFHSHSAMVDNALLLIGKSYYYQGEYVKAERKFMEMFAQFPGSDLVYETQVWYLRTLVQLKRYPEIFREAPAFLAMMLEKDRKNLAGEVYMVLGMVHQDSRDIHTAVENYLLAAENVRDAWRRAEARKAVADLYHANGDFKNSIAAYRKLYEIAPDQYFEYEALVSISKGYRAQKNYHASLRTLDELVEDFRFERQRDLLLLERARVLADQGDMEEALAEYEYVDTTFARSESGARAAFERAILLERFGEYETAWQAYAKAGSGPVASIAAEARRKSLAYNRYFESQKALAKSDSVRTLDPGDEVVTVNNDSLLQVEAKALYALGEIFYSDIPNVDSTLLYYSRALKTLEDSSLSPRAIYVLSDLARASPEKSSRSSDEWQRELVRKYPSSPYGLEVRRLRGEAPDAPGMDPADQQYRLAEQKLESNLFQEAIRDLRSLASAFPHSPFASKSLYTVGWVYENHLALPESALTYYRLVLEQHPETQYAEVAKRKVPGPSPDGQEQPKGKEAEKSESRNRIVDEVEKRGEPKSPLPPGKKQDNDQ
jgi:tetratricopeptide (TPR) repeat protein